MKRYIIKILLFFAIVAIIDISVGKFGDYLQANAQGGITSRTNDLLMKDNHDVVILGSSRAHHHYDAPLMSDILGLDVYNAGYDGNGIVLAYGILSMILERYNPQLVVFDVEAAFDINVYEPDNNHIRYLGYLKPYYRNATVAGIFKDISSEEWYKVHSGMIRYNTTILSMCADYNRSYDKSMRGYAPLEGQYIGEPETKKADVEVDYFKLAYVEKLIKLAKDKKVPLLIIASPMYGAESSYDVKAVIDICKTQGVPFLDYYSVNEYNNHKDWFKDSMHLNEIGAEQFTKELCEVFKVIEMI